MFRIVKNFFNCSVFHQFARIHHRTVIAHFRYNAEVMRDQDHGCTLFLLQRSHHIQNLRLDRNVKSCCRLIRDQKFRFAGQRDRDHDTLFHTAGKLMWVILIPLRNDAYHRKHILRTSQRLHFGTMTMQKNHFRDLLSYCFYRIQRRHRILKDHRNLFAADVAHLAL